MADLPQPKQNAVAVNEVIGAVFASIPVLATVGELTKIALRRRFEQAEKILIAEVKRQGIDALTDEQLEFFVPSSYRFLEQARLGEYDYNLELLAKIIAGSIRSGAMDPMKVSRGAEMLNGLTTFELSVFSFCMKKYHEMKDAHPDNIHVSASKLSERFEELREHSNLEINSALSRLASRSILFQRSPALMDTEDPFFLPSTDGIELYAKAIEVTA